MERLKDILAVAGIMGVLFFGGVLQTQDLEDLTHVNASSTVKTVSAVIITGENF